jgi:hypothetical protein
VFDKCKPCWLPNIVLHTVLGPLKLLKGDITTSFVPVIDIYLQCVCLRPTYYLAQWLSSEPFRVVTLRSLRETMSSLMKHDEHSLAMFSSNLAALTNSFESNSEGLHPLVKWMALKDEQ